MPIYTHQLTRIVYRASFPDTFREIKQGRGDYKTVIPVLLVMVGFGVWLAGFLRRTGSYSIPKFLWNIIWMFVSAQSSSKPIVFAQSCHHVYSILIPKIQLSHIKVILIKFCLHYEWKILKLSCCEAGYICKAIFLVIVTFYLFFFPSWSWASSYFQQQGVGGGYEREADPHEGQSHPGHQFQAPSPSGQVV